MTKCKAFAIPLLLAGMVQIVQAESPIPPEVTTAVELSSSDINRIVCPGMITDLIFSKEKGLDGHFVGHNAFVKFTVTVQDEEKIYTTTPTELFVSCNDTIYSLIATPKRIPSVTLRLAPAPTEDLKQNISRYQSLPFEKKVLQLIREAYQGVYPNSYRIAPADTMIHLADDLFVRLERIVDVEGVGLRLKEYRVKAVNGKNLHVTEKDFLRAELGTNIVAVVVENHAIEPGNASRVFIVEQRGEAS